MIHIIKNLEEIKNIKISGQIASETLQYIFKYIKPGISTGKINDICYDRIVNYHNAYPAALKYMGFPKSICTSVNDVVCHGIPSYNCILNEGDIINVDIAVCKNNYYADTSKMFFVGRPSDLAIKLCKIAEKSLYLSLKCIKDGGKFKNIGYIIQKYVNYKGYSVVKNYCGHGIGKKLHEEPHVLHYKNNCDLIFRSGMIFTIEPMINIGSEKIIVTDDGWTVKTKDGSLSAQYEHTILVTNNGYQILTL